MLAIVTLAVFVVTSAGCARAVCIVRDEFGSYSVSERGDEKLPVYRYTLSNNQVTVQVVEYGATITSIKVPDCSGRPQDVLLGFDTLEGYFGADNPYIGATVGRVANRIANGVFTLDGQTYNLFQNNGKHTLHGGKRAFDKKLWSSKMTEDKVIFQYTSEDLEEGFPGQVTVLVTYSLRDDNTLVIEYTATATKRTPINLTNHAYFNLAGHDAGAEALYNHTVSILADQVTEVDKEFIPTGKLTSVAETQFDLRQEQKLGDAIKKTSIDGFDFNYVLPEHKTGAVVARVEYSTACRRLHVQTTQPGLQFYTSNSIDSITGKGGVVYHRHAAFCLEAQNFPDAINHQEEFPNVVYGPHDIYHEVTKYKFEVTSDASNI